jgi:hypothetical protein
MAERRIIVCDVDEEERGVTYTVTYCGDTYTVDLCEVHSAPLRVLAEKSRKRGSRGSRRRTVKVDKVPVNPEFTAPKRPTTP